LIIFPPSEFAFVLVYSARVRQEIIL